MLDPVEMKAAADQMCEIHYNNHSKTASRLDPVEMKAAADLLFEIHQNNYSETELRLAKVAFDFHCSGDFQPYYSMEPMLVHWRGHYLNEIWNYPLYFHPDILLFGYLLDRVKMITYLEQSS